MFDLRTRRERSCLPEPLEEDRLLKAATRGDLDAIAWVAISFGDMLRDEARIVLGDALAHEASAVVQQFCDGLDGLRFRMRRGAALPFMRRQVRALARDVVKSHERKATVTRIPAPSSGENRESSVHTLSEGAIRPRPKP
jgi:hypothetical protein